MSKSLVKKIRGEEERLSQSGVFTKGKAYHPVVNTIWKWMEMPSASSELAYLWLDAEIHEVFGPLVSRGELLRVICLNVSFGGKIQRSSQP